MDSSKVQIKGIREGLLITLGDGPWAEIHQALLEHLDQQGGFLKGGKLALEVGSRVLKAVELSQLRNEISDREISLWAVISDSPTTESTAQTLGLATRLSKPRPEVFTHPQPVQPSGENAIVVQRTLRSGAKVQSDGHVVVIGDVNPGAEIVASGNIIVWGRLRGVAHAGAGGNENALVCALDLSPIQLRIAGKIAVTPQRRSKPMPELARLQKGEVVSEVWNPKK